MRTTRPPVDYMVTTSKTSLESFQCARLNLAASLRKEVRQILDEWISVEVDARIAAWILDRRRAQETGRDPTGPLQSAPVHFAQLAMSFLPPSPDEPRNEEAGSEEGDRALPRPEVPSGPSAQPPPLASNPSADQTPPACGIPLARASRNSAVGSAKLPLRNRRGIAAAFDAHCALRLLERLDDQSSLETNPASGAVPALSHAQQTIASLERRTQPRSGSNIEARPAQPLRVHFARRLARQRRLVAAS